MPLPGLLHFRADPNPLTCEGRQDRKRTGLNVFCGSATVIDEQWDGIGKSSAEFAPTYK